MANLSKSQWLRKYGECLTGTAEVLDQFSTMSEEAKADMPADMPPLTIHNLNVGKSKAERFSFWLHERVTTMLSQAGALERVEDRCGTVGDILPEDRTTWSDEHWRIYRSGL